MRNFEERKAEVFRRSENRIKERKRTRRRILALCIPLCLILTAWSATVLPSMLPAEDGIAENQPGGSLSDGMTDTDSVDRPSLVHTFVSVDVKGAGAQAQHRVTISDAPGVSRVFAQLHTIFLAHEVHNDIVGGCSDGTVMDGDPETPVHDGSDGITDSPGDANESSYIITMTDVDGAERTFTLTDNRLYDAAFHIEIALTDGQLRDLKAALGLTD